MKERLIYSVAFLLWLLGLVTVVIPSVYWVITGDKYYDAKFGDDLLDDIHYKILGSNRPK